jgi:hypothetical protein
MSPLLLTLDTTLVKLLFGLGYGYALKFQQEGTARLALGLRNSITGMSSFLAIHDFTLVMK